MKHITHVCFSPGLESPLQDLLPKSTAVALPDLSLLAGFLGHYG